MSDASRVSRREQELLDKLEVIQRDRKRVTVTSFCKLVGYANKSALRHFPVLRRELGLYVAQLNPAGKRGSQTSAVRHLEVQIERLQRECDRQARQLTKIPELEKQISKLRAELKHSQSIIGRLRAMISTLISFFSNNDLSKARDISNRLEKLAKASIEEDILPGYETQDSFIGV